MNIRTYIFIVLAVLLLALVIFLTVKKLPHKKILRVFIKIGISAAIVIFALGAIIFPDLKPIKSTGKYKYETVVYQIEDTTRTDEYNPNSNRKLSILAYYPTNPEKECPLFVFSHGGISFKTSNVSLFGELASHGYIVLSIDHTYQALSTKIDGKKISMDTNFRKEIMNEDSHKDINDSFQCYQKWLPVRINDLDFTINDALAKKQDRYKFFDNIDESNIILSGHSLGGAAAYGTARKRKDIKAVIALESPYLADIIGVDGNDFIWNETEYDCAMLNFYSDSGSSLVENDHKYYQNKKYLTNTGNIGYCYIKGANHYTLTDLVRTSPLLCQILGGGYSLSGSKSLKIINETTLNFLNKVISPAE